MVLEIVMICRRTGDSESKARVEPPSGCIHPKDAQPEGLSFHLGSLDQPPDQNGTGTSPLKPRQEEDLCRKRSEGRSSTTRIPARTSSMTMSL
jgi:hypothetical protein